ncbi:MAG: hypothetical protein OXC54_11735 [Rhodospirillaceae bacterium]|nr:hypothetical protein [Rhodospirillaceae bacterium]MCY4238904.1 hypothetical protein [Rhodospirillaceae bacterium]MCY4311958.1 hypothetical protein [Rhodospirillaceae bacterium]
MTTDLEAVFAMGRQNHSPLYQLLRETVLMTDHAPRGFTIPALPTGSWCIGCGERVYARAA